MNTLGLACALGLILSVTACGGENADDPSPQGGVGSCPSKNGGTCTDYLGSAFTTAFAQDRCQRSAGNYSSSACPSTNRVGSCALEGDQPYAEAVRFYSPQMALATAQDTCTILGGAFTAN